MIDNELIEAIYVEASDKSSGHRVQRIHIKYSDIGFIPINELRQSKRRDRSHAASLENITFSSM